MIKKKAVAGGIVALAAVLGGGGIFAWTRRIEDTETLADNQKYVYAYVTSIEGNELTYVEVDESVVEAYLASSTENTENAEKGGDGSGRLEEAMDQGHLEEVMPQERLEMVWGRQEMAQERQGIARRRLEMARGRLAGCRRELPEQMIARRCRTG